MKCVKCGGKTRSAVSNRIYFDKIVVNPVKVQKCAKCGEEFLSEKEYERIRKKVEGIKNGTSKEILKNVQVLVT